MKTISNQNSLRKKTNVFLLLAISFSLFITSCKKEDNEVPQPNGQALADFFKNNRNEDLQSFNVNIDGGTQVTGSQGTVVTFPANSIGLNGVPVSGNVEIELVEIYDKASMLVNNMPTTGIKPNGDHEILKSAGEFYLNATQGGNQLEILLPVEIQSKGSDPSEWDSGMKVFRAGDELQATDLWEEADENEDGENDKAEGRDGEGPDGYVIYSVFDISSFGWTNLDRWYNYNGTLTNIFIDVPDGFDGDNCEVYLSYDGEPTALARMDVYDSSAELFTEHYGRIPVGQAVHIILVTEIGGQLYYTIQGTTVVMDHTEVMAYPQPTTQAALETLINSLP